jgi:hypothetical protein
MTIVTGVLADDMPGSFASRPDTIVAAITGLRYTGMLEPSRAPASGLMTIIAIITALKVGWCFTTRLDSIMTTDTGAGNRHVIHASVCPGVFIMTIVTGVTAFNMICRLKCIGKQAGRAMTSLTALGCTFENTMFVAVIAGLSGMCTVENKTGVIMIEFGFCCPEITRQCERGSDKNQYKYGLQRIVDFFFHIKPRLYESCSVTVTCIFRR